MKQQLFRFFGVVMSVWIIAINCKKTEIPIIVPPTPITKTDMLVYSRWKLLAEGFDTNKDGIIDLDETPTHACLLDNLIFFFQGGRGSFDQGATKCDPDHAQSRGFEWTFTNSGSMIIVDGQEYTILSLTESEFVVTYEYIFTNPRSNYILKLTH